MKKISRKILVIDDNPGMLKVLDKWLKVAGYDVAEAWDGRMGLDTARREKPDLILLDILMPNMDGKEFVRNLRREPELKDTPVIFITVCIDLEKDKGHETIEVDGIHYPGFAKPLHNARLLSLIRKTLNRRANSSSDDKSDEDPDE
ncbi:MAG: response regulator [Candidatus Omnitrophica bacterium]|nr:response regulator [Candidatus Omnitrophota bacterium]